jgi:hypothetical protein
MVCFQPPCRVAAPLPSAFELSPGQRARRRRAIRDGAKDSLCRSTMKSTLVPLANALENAPPWLSPYAPLAQRVLHATHSQSVVAALNAARDNSPSSARFIEHSALPADEPYESFVSRTGYVPTRENLHDLFNGLIWLTYPQTKQRLNSLHAQQIAQHGASGPRGSLRDALTVFDENAAVLQAPAGLVDALRQRDWNTLFVAQRAQWHSARLVIFGHALMEKLMQPRKAITGHVWVIEELTDAALASSLTQERLSTRLFLPLPVLGVPGWWEANTEPGYYDDADVFRPTRIDSLSPR